MQRWKKAAIAAGVFLVLLLSFIAFILPGIVRGKAVEKVEALTGRKFQLASVSINPLTWRAELRGVRLSEKDPAVTFASFSSVRVTLSPASLYRRAPILREIVVTSPYIRIVRVSANSFNFSDLQQRDKQAPAAKKSDEPARFSLNNITIARGSCDFIDQAAAVPKSHAIRSIEVGIPFISNIPYLADRYVLPKFHAVVNGSPFSAEGKLKPFAKSAETSFAIDLKEVDLPFYAGYIPATLPVRVEKGKLATHLDVTYRVEASRKPELAVSGGAALRDIVLKDRKGEALTSLPDGRVTLSRASVLSGVYDIGEITLNGLQLHVSRDREGKWTHDRLRGAPAPEKRPEEKKEPPKITVAKLAVNDLKLHFRDAVPAGGFATTVDADFTMDGFSSFAPQPAPFALDLATERGEELTLEGSFAAAPVSFVGDLQLSGVPLEPYYPYLAPFLTAPLKGKGEASAALSFADGDLKISGGRLALANFGASFGGSDGAKVGKITVEDVALSLKERRAEVGLVAITRGDVALSRSGDGSLSPMTLLKQSPPPAAAPAAPAKKAEKGTPFRYRVKKVTGSGLRVAFTDAAREEKPVFELSKISFALGGISGPEAGPISFRFASVYGLAGKLETQGSVLPKPLRLKGNCLLEKIPLRDFEPYFPDDLLVSVADGSLDLQASVDVAKASEGWSGTFSGGAGVRNFYALGTEEQEDLLKWESLQLDGISGSLSPPSLQMKEVALNNFFVKILVDRDGKLNLTQLRAPPEKPAAAAVPTPPSAPPPPALAAAPAAPATPKKLVTIETVVFQDGTVDFVDRHLPKPYTAKMVNLGGRVSGLSSEEAKFADVDLRGNLDNRSPLRITGRVNPLRDDLFVDLKVSFTDIDLSPVTPYSGRYLGYEVEKGKLFLDLAYRIQQKKLESENRIFIDQFTFGKGVESDKATALPVRLAVALLKDRKGEIHLDLPVTGRTDDPKFSIWGVVFQVLKNLLVKAATSPFALLQSVFGSKDDFSSVVFGYGSSQLSAAEKEKLNRFAGVLKERPGLKLEVAGFVDREKDAEGYRSELLLRKLKTEKFLELAKEKKGAEGQSIDSMQVGNEEYSRYLKAVYLKEKFPKPRTFIGTVKDIPDPEKKKLILTNTVVTEEHLQALARERATAVQGYLAGAGKLEKERIFVKSGDIFRKSEREGDPGSRVELGIAAK